MSFGRGHEGRRIVGRRGLQFNCALVEISHQEVKRHTFAGGRHVDLDSFKVLR